MTHGATLSLPPGASVRIPLFDRLVLFPLLCVYAVLVQFGTLIKFGEGEIGAGISTIVLLVVVALGLTRCIRGLLTEAPFWVLWVLLFYMTIPSLLMGPARTLPPLLMFAATVSRVPLKHSHLLAFWVISGGAVLLSAGLTIVDFAGLVDVPYANQVFAQTKLGEGYAVEQATGFFVRRSAMATLFSLPITGALVLVLAHKSLRVRLFSLAVVFTGVLCLFLTHNRSGVLSPILVVAVYALVSSRFNVPRRIANAMGLGVVGVVFASLVVIFFPEQAATYLARLGFIGLAEQTWEGDSMRLELFLVALESIGSRPMGNGLSLVEVPYGPPRNAHNVVTAVVWGAGLFALVWIPAFALSVYRYFRRRSGPAIANAPEHDAVRCALFTWLVNGMTHDTLYTGLAWLLFGILLSINYFGARIEAAAAPERGAARDGSFGTAGEVVGTGWPAWQDGAYRR